MTQAQTVSGAEIHPTAIVDSNAIIGQNVKIGAYSIVGAHVSLADGVVLHPHVVVDGHTTVGAETHIFPFASIGTRPQDLKFHGEKSRLEIGARCQIREHVTMNPGTEGGGMLTKVGDDCLIMIGCHVAHDCQIGNRVIMANNATLAGHVVVGDHALVGGLSAVHQFVRIGRGAVIGGMSGVERDVIPYGRVKGERAHLDGLNLTGLERSGLGKDVIRHLQKTYKTLFAGEGTFDERVQSVTEAHQDECEHVKEILEFIQSEDSRFSVCQPRP